jgi:hypothetical protein
MLRSRSKARTWSHQTSRTEGTETHSGGSSPPTRLPRALRALAHEAMLTEDDPYPLAEWCNFPRRREGQRHDQRNRQVVQR